MSWLLVVLPDSAHADALRNALRTRISDELVVARSLEAGLASIDLSIPDVILVPPLMPAVEDYLVAYLATIPGARHVQILGIPDLLVPDGNNDRNKAVQAGTRSPFLWKRRPVSPAFEPPACHPDAFAEDVVTYLARARELRAELASARTNTERRRGVERRSDPRFANHEVPWISLVRLGDKQALLLDVSSRGALLRTEIRPEHYLLKRADRGIRTGARLTLELAFERQIHAAGRVVRCVPSTTGPRTQYDVAFLFDESVGLHLPASEALVQVTSADGLRLEPLSTRDRARLDGARGDMAG